MADQFRRLCNTVFSGEEELEEDCGEATTISLEMFRGLRTVLFSFHALIAWCASLLGLNPRCLFGQSKTKPIREQIEQTKP